MAENMVLMEIRGKLMRIPESRVEERGEWAARRAAEAAEGRELKVGGYSPPA